MREIRTYGLEGGGAQALPTPILLRRGLRPGDGGGPRCHKVPRATWFDTARFGMFIHWGISSVGGWELSWPLVGGVAVLPHSDNVSIDDYYACAAKFRPSHFDPRGWARLARRAGMQYGVLTAKHHDGFAMFDTQLSDFSAVRAAAGTDFVGEYVEAFRAEGLRVGLYFSLSDWHHPDYPAFRETDKPYNFFALPQPTPEQWSRYLELLFGQVRELLTNYGRIDLIWFDGQWERQPPGLSRANFIRCYVSRLAASRSDSVPSPGFSLISPMLAWVSRRAVSSCRSRSRFACSTIDRPMRRCSRSMLTTVTSTGSPTFRT